MIKESRLTETFLPKIRRGLQFSGYLTNASKHVGIGFLLRRNALHALRLLIVVQSALVPVTCWRTWGLELRVVWLQECTFEIATITYSLMFFYSKANPHTFERLIQPIQFLVDENEGDSPSFVSSGEVSGIVDREDAANFNLLIAVKTNLELLIYTYAMKPIFRILLHWWGAKPIDVTALPIMCFNPFIQPITPDVIKVSHLLILTLPQLIYLYDLTMGVNGAHVGLFLCIGNVVTDMKVLKCELDQMKRLLEQQSNTPSLVVTEDDVNDWRDLNQILRQICCHHQAVFRKIEEISKLFTFPIIILNALAGFYVCLGVYCVVKGEELSTIITFCVVTLMGIFFCHIFCENGQRIETEGENLRLALYDCYVVGLRPVPLWYQHSILMMMLRHDQPPGLSPFQIFRLNRTSLTVLMKGALSYFNLLNSFSE